jgi:hypothetical protein
LSTEAHQQIDSCYTQNRPVHHRNASFVLVVFLGSETYLQPAGEKSCI